MNTTTHKSPIQQILYESIFGTFTMQDKVEMRSIFFHRLISLPNGQKTRVLKAGMEVTCIDGELVDAANSICATHIILQMFGTLANTNFELKVRDLFTEEITFVKL